MSTPRICIYGAGAIGGFLAARLAETDVDLSLVARGAHLAAIQAHGLRLRSGGVETICHPRATDDPRELGPQDYVIVTLKAHSLPGIAHELHPLFDRDTAVIMAVNGLPWWYFHRLPGPHAERHLRSVDPGDRQWTYIGPQRVIGAVVYPACTVIAPGLVDHLDGDRFSLGEPSGEKTARVANLAAILRSAGLKAPVRTALREEIWVKLWGNLCFNPLSALTGATLETLCATPGIHAVARRMMVEAQAIGEAIGVNFPVTVDQRIAGAAAVGAHKTSMLQDLAAGRALEIDALVTVVQELGHLVGIATPTIDAVLALVQLRAHNAGCYQYPHTL